MQEKSAESQSQLNDILNEAIDLTENRSSYVNVVHFSIGVNEMILDMYFMGQNPKKLGQSSAQAQYLHRIAMPLGVAKEIANLMQQAIEQWENTFGISLPFAPQGETEQSVSNEKDNSNE